MRKHTGSCWIIALSGFLHTAACIKSEDISKTPSPTDIYDDSVATLQIEHKVAQKDIGVVTNPGVESIETLLEARAAEYETVFQDARNRGAIGGAVRGGLIGILIAGSPEGAFAGALLGGAVGVAIVEHAASALVTEHRNYVIRRWSLDQIIEAARNDTRNTRFDLLLSQQAVAKLDDFRNVVKNKDEHRAIALLSNFQNHAQIRALALHEIVPLYRDDETAANILLNELSLQINMIEQLQTNVDVIRGN